ncbi:gliding motility-associated C-terminal domain-containing protein [Belliella kenyensis]|uniref:Gliding motility-associated C-terminal domain-containing protein n=1 Tax=Belliella kenyensis TaxID=1472724 RepID=A0ABV8EPC0_9BACT|nr:gliding motility-associated C-terminal domain-containing protein [Belliella kenyensis]MCH7401941.1 gliding motility-associated C-terminal domain-containing protein [Belliella kenyensis]MDN3605105.1 gliding motility-associated C-terminal domain-containing protein [Belliella kenyensis]
MVLSILSLGCQYAIAQSMTGDRYLRFECERIAEFRVRGGQPPYTYVWTYDSEIVQIDENFGSSDISILTQAKRGMYTSTVTDANGDVYSDSFFFQGSSNFTLNVDVLQDNNCEGITFGRIVGEINNGVAPFIVTIYNESRQVVRSTPISGNTINLTGFQAGTYLVEVQNANGCIEFDEVELDPIIPIRLARGGSLGAFPSNCVDNGSIAYDILQFEGDVRFRIRRRSPNGYINTWTTAPNGQIRYEGLSTGEYFLEIADDFRQENCPEIFPFTIEYDPLLFHEITTADITCFGDSNGSILFEIERNPDNSTLPEEVEITLSNSAGQVLENVINIDMAASSFEHLFDNLLSGNYFITFSHGGTNYPECTQIFEIEINSPDSPLVSNATSENIKCFGENSGVASVNPSGGWEPYTYLWSNGSTDSQINNLPVGNYFVDIIDAGGCSIREMFEIVNIAPALEARIEILDDLSCVGANDGVARVFNIQGGVEPYTFLWSIGQQNTERAEGLPEGEVSVTITDALGCSITLFENLSSPPPPEVVIESFPVSCSGESDGRVNIQINGTANYNVSIGAQTLTGNNVVFENLPEGEHTVSITYEGICNLTLDFTIESVVSVEFDTSNLQVSHVSCFGQSDGFVSGLSIQGGNGNLTISWQKLENGNYVNINGNNSLNLLGIEAGTYKITATDENGCFSEIEFAINEPDPFVVNGLQTEPISCINASDGSVTFSINGGNLPYAYSLNGASFISTTENIITIPNLSSGNGYNLIVRDANNCNINELQFDILSPEEIRIDLISISQESCYGVSDGYIFIETSGGDGQLQHQWYLSNDLNNVIANTESLEGIGPGSYVLRVSEIDNQNCFLERTFEILPTPELQLELDESVVHIICYGESTGSISIQVSGGTGDYSFAWSGSNGYFSSEQNISNIPAGIYSVRVIDQNGCYRELTNIEVTQPEAPLSIETLSTRPPSCPGAFDGTLQVRISGGSPGYYISWQRENENGVFENFRGSRQSLVGIRAGNYKIIVRDIAGCIEEHDVTLEGPDEIVISALSVQNASCFGRNDGSINIQVTGGTFPYRFEWDHGFINQNPQNLGVGNYAVTITDARGCVARLEDISITQPDQLSINLIDINEPSCEHTDGRIEVEFVGGDETFSSQWFRLPENVLVAENTNILENVSPGIYSVTFGNGTSCSVNNIINVAGPTNPLRINIDALNPTCIGQNGIIAISASGGLPSYRYFISLDGVQEELDSNIITNLESGNYIITVRDSRGCEDSDSITINNPNQPVYDVEKVQDASCFGGNDGQLTFQTLGDFNEISYQWYRRESNGSLSPISSDTLNELGAGRYFVRFQYNDNCTLDSEDYIITQPDEIQIFTQNIQTFCFGESGQVILNISGGNFGKTITLTGQNGVTRSITGFYTGIATFDNLTSGTYEVNVIDQNGCQTPTTTIEIIESEPIQINLASIQEVSCRDGNDGSIEIEINGGSGDYQVQWSNGQEGLIISALTAGSYTVFVNDGNSCVSSETFIISQPTEHLTIQAIFPTEICTPDDTIDVTLNVQGGTAPYTYLWSNGSTNTSLINVSTGNYEVTVTDSNGCSEVLEFEIPVPRSTLQISFEGNTTICSSGGHTMLSASISGGAAPYTYLWSTGARGPIASNLTSGTYSLTVTDSNGCIAIEEVEILPPSNLSMRLDELVHVTCFGGSDGRISISIEDGNSPFEIIWSHGVRNQTSISGLVAGNYNVSITDASGCITSATYNIREPELISYNETVENVTCFGAANGRIELNVRGGTAPYSYAWSNGFNGRNPQNLPPGTYSVIITDRNGCSTGGSFNISEPTLLSMTADHSENLNCYGDDQGYINVSVAGGMQPYTIIWSDNDQITSFNRSGLIAGSYTVRLIDDNNCIIEQTFQIREPEPLEARLNHRFDIDCENQTMVGVAWLEISGGVPNYQITWSNGVNNSTEIEFNNSGRISTIITDSNGCQVEISDQVELPLVFSESDFIYTIPSIGTTGEILVNDEVQFLDRTLGNVIAWEWSFGDGTNTSTQNATHTYQKPGIYEVTLKTFDIYGCVSEATITIEVLASYRIMIPNAFTPNGDGINDFFLPKLRGIKTFEFYIFNKWGEMIYSHVIGEDQGWDGQLNGKMSPNGNYVYKLVFEAEDGEKGSQTGVFTLIN